MVIVMIRLPPETHGHALTRNFSWWRRASEYFQDLIYRDSWPAAWTSRILAPSFRVWHERLELRKPLGAAPRLRLAFAADFHAGPLTPPDSIRRACEALTAAKPDLILLGGDFVSVAPRHVTRLLEHFRALRAPLGVFAVLGNHDYWAGARAVEAAVREAGVEFLINRSHRLPAPFENTLVAGLDDHICGHPDPEGPQWDPTAATILLIHAPSGLLDAGARPFDVALAGHTHGGQIHLPGGFAPVVPQGALSRQYLAGRYALPGGGHLLVTVGVGNSSVPIRLGPVPEVLICDLVAARTTP
jgi:predicted MPP superfamily phosphohydrolase